jgi:ribA/ribD-fused uncharacterized protein
MDIIDDFRGPYSFLSNFFPAKVLLDGYEFASVEHAYQAAKTFDAAQRALIACTKSPVSAKRLGRKITMRPDWDRVKESVMLDLLRQKFQIPQLRQYLLETHNARLIEGNWWNDTYWGVCNGKGLNRLGVLLMQIRGEIQHQ